MPRAARFTWKCNQSNKLFSLSRFSSLLPLHFSFPPLFLYLHLYLLFSLCFFTCVANTCFLLPERRNPKWYKIVYSVMFTNVSCQLPVISTFGHNFTWLSLITTLPINTGCYKNYLLRFPPIATHPFSSLCALVSSSFLNILSFTWLNS